MAASRIALLLPILSLLLAPPSFADDATTAHVVDESYLVQAGDTLQVSVWKEPDLTGEVLVRPDGALSFPLAGEVEAAGHTVEDIRKVLQSRFSKYIPDPVVTVVVKKAEGSRIYVVG